MKTFALAFGAIFLLGLLGLALGPWWSLLVIGFIVGIVLRPRYPGSLFVAGLAAGAALWGVGALWFGASAGELPGLIAQLFAVGSPLVLGIVVAAVGGLSAGLFAALGGYCRAVVQGEKA